MTSPVITTQADTDIAEVARLLRRNRISAVLVTDSSGSLVGLVSEYDLLAKQGVTAKDVMTTGLVSVSEDSDIEDVRHLLVERKIRRVPVMAAGQLVGIVSRADVVATMVTEWVCEICGEAVRGSQAPSKCPRCHGEKAHFVLQEQLPGS